MQKAIRGRKSEPGSQLQRKNVARGTRSAGNSPASSPIQSRNMLPLQLKGIRTRSQSITAVPTNLPDNPPTSPGISPSESDPDSITVVGRKDKKPSIKKKDICPCGKSSAGTEWLLPCNNCSQIWHNSCAGLKGSFTRAVLDSLLKTWQCPWCFVCAYPKSGKHKTAKNDDLLSEKVLTSAVFQEIAESVAEAVEKSVKMPDISTLEKLVAEFTQQLNDFQIPSADNTTFTQGCVIPQQRVSHQETHLKEECTTPEKPFSNYQEGFLSAELFQNSFNFLKDCKNTGLFTQENGHSVLAFGEAYSYTGSRTEEKDITLPPQIKEIIDQVVTGLNLDHTPNAVLINHFPPTSAEGDTQSFLSHHSDDEPTIVADTSIVTLSFGGERKITFKPVHDANNPDLKTALTPKSNSVYVMSRSSQAWFKHGIPQTTDVVEDRYSITLRTINQKFCRSTLIIGDSNTKDLVFGSGKGTFGESFPGKRIKAGNIKSIDPKRCVGYANIVIACGTNDLRPENMHHNRQVNHLVEALRQKLLQIGKIAPNSKITVLPVLPTRSHKMNQNVVMYNNCVSEMISHCFNDIWFPGIYHFLDRDGMLSAKFTRTNDLYHLNERGIAQLVSVVKQCVYRRESENRAVRKRDQQPTPAPT